MTHQKQTRMSQTRHLGTPESWDRHNCHRPDTPVHLERTQLSRTRHTSKPGTDTLSHRRHTRHTCIWNRYTCQISRLGHSGAPQGANLAPVPSGGRTDYDRPCAWAVRRRCAGSRYSRAASRGSWCWSRQSPGRAGSTDCCGRTPCHQDGRAAGGSQWSAGRQWVSGEQR